MAWLAVAVGFVPLAWVAYRRPAGAEYRWLAAAFAVSGVADLLAFVWRAPSLVSPLYVVGQSALIGYVFLLRRDAARFLAALALTAVAAAMTVNRPHRPDVLLHTVAWLAIAGIVWDRPALGLLRTSMLVTFGLGLLAWLAYCIVFYAVDHRQHPEPAWVTWGALQSARLAGALLFCRATVTGPVVRRA